MFRDNREELKRLENALLEAELEEPEEEEEAPPPVVEDVPAYSNVTCDVDLEDYEETVRQGPSVGLLSIFLIVLTVAFCVVAWVVLKQGGYLG